MKSRKRKTANKWELNGFDSDRKICVRHCIVPTWAAKHGNNWKCLPSCPGQTWWRWWRWGWWWWWWWWPWGGQRAYPGPWPALSLVTTSPTTSSSLARVTRSPSPLSRGAQTPVTRHFSTLSSGIMSDSSDKRYFSQQSLSCWKL